MANTPKKLLQKKQQQAIVRSNERQRFTKEPIPVEVARELRELNTQISNTPI